MITAMSDTRDQFCWLGELALLLLLLPQSSVGQHHALTCVLLNDIIITGDIMNLKHCHQC